MLINFVDATNDANHYTKPPPMYSIKYIDFYFVHFTDVYVCYVR